MIGEEIGKLSDRKDWRLHFSIGFPQEGAGVEESKKSEVIFISLRLGFKKGRGLNGTDGSTGCGSFFGLSVPRLATVVNNGKKKRKEKTGSI